MLINLSNNLRIQNLNYVHVYTIVLLEILGVLKIILWCTYTITHYKNYTRYEYLYTSAKYIRNFVYTTEKS